MWTENKNFTISDRWPLYLFYFDFWQWNNLRGVGGLCVLKATTKKSRQLFLRKKCIRVTWLKDVLTSKWPGSFALLAPKICTHCWNTNKSWRDCFFSDSPCRSAIPRPRRQLSAEERCEETRTWHPSARYSGHLWYRSTSQWSCELSAPTRPTRRSFPTNTRLHAAIATPGRQNATRNVANSLVVRL